MWTFLDSERKLKKAHRDPFALRWLWTLPTSLPHSHFFFKSTAHLKVLVIRCCWRSGTKVCLTPPTLYHRFWQINGRLSQSYFGNGPNIWQWNTDHCILYKITFRKQSSCDSNPTCSTRTTWCKVNLGSLGRLELFFRYGTGPSRWFLYCG